MILFERRLRGCCLMLLGLHAASGWRRSWELNIQTLFVFHLEMRMVFSASGSPVSMSGPTWRHTLKYADYLNECPTHSSMF
jgi:hypothetical protein